MEPAGTRVLHLSYVFSFITTSCQTDLRSWMFWHQVRVPVAHVLDYTRCITWGWRRLFSAVRKRRLDKVSACLRPCTWLHRTMCARHHFTFFQLSLVPQYLAAACVLFASQLLVLLLDQWCLLFLLPVLGSPPPWLSVICHLNITCGGPVLCSEWSLCRTGVCAWLVVCRLLLETEKLSHGEGSEGHPGFGGKCCHQSVQLRCGTAHYVATQTARLHSIVSFSRCFSPISINHWLDSLVSGDLILPLESVQGCLSCPFYCGLVVAGRLQSYENISAFVSHARPFTGSSLIDIQHHLVYVSTECCANSVLIWGSASSSFWEFEGYHLNLFVSLPFWRSLGSLRQCQMFDAGTRPVYTQLCILP